MKKLNNKGITTIEVIICFILVVTITTSMFATVSSFNQKRIIEQYKEEIYTYKNLLTKEIQDDFIKIGVTTAEYKTNVSGSKTIHSVNCIMKDGSKRQLIIIQQFSKSEYHPSGSASVNDYYMIKYGATNNFVDISVNPLPESGDIIEYPIPELGSFKDDDTGKIVQDFSINNVSVTITPDNVLNIYIGFYHPELTTRYGIQVICPINYVSTGRDSGSRFNLYTASGIVPDTPTPPTPTPFSFTTATWAQIAAATPEQLQAAMAAGETKDVNMGSLGTHKVRIANLSTPSECNGSGYSKTACGKVIEFADIITTHNMNSPNSTEGGWPATSMRTYVSNDIYNALPSDLKNVIINTTVVSGHDQNGTTNFTSTDKLYLLSPKEVWKTDNYDSSANATRQLDYYQNKGVTTSNYSAAIKQRSGSNATWWLRSAYSGSTISFNDVSSNGNWHAYSSSMSSGVSPAFRIG